MKVLHLLALGGAGGIESLCVDVAQYSKDENHFYFLWGGGVNAEKIKSYTQNVVIRNFEKRNIWKEYTIFCRYVLDEKIDCIVIQGMSPVMLIYFKMILRKYPELKGVLYLHANSEDLFPKKWVKKLFQWACKRADGCIAISESVKESMKGICDTDNIFRIYNGIDYEKFHTAKREKRSDIVQLIFAGRIVKKKGLSLLLDALEDIHAPYELTIIGEGAEKENLERTVFEAGLVNKVKFVGSQWNIENWLANADIFVHPATWKEGFGIALIEAMAAGLPCVAFRRGATSEIITDNVDGYLVDEVCTMAYSARLKEVIRQWKEEPEHFAAIAANAQKRAACFDISRYVNKLSGFLQEL